MSADEERSHDSHDLEEEDEETYEIEKILKMRSVHGVTEYLAKWKNYEEDENTWEPEEEVVKCQVCQVKTYFILVNYRVED